MVDKQIENQLIVFILTGILFEKCTTVVRVERKKDMLDVFKEEYDILVKNGMANIVWKRDDLIDLWEKVGVPLNYCLEMRKKLK